MTMTIAATPVPLSKAKARMSELARSTSPSPSETPEPRSTWPARLTWPAPATYNTINKWAQGISDTYALGVLAETTGLGVPTVVLPFVNAALASRAPFRRNVESLRAEGVRILLGPGRIQPYPPRTGSNLIDSYPWRLGLDEAERTLDSPARQS